MKIFESSDDLQFFLDSYKSNHKKVALVPTMGGLHDGHLRLVEKAQALADVVVVSIFVNPTQFSKGEDFESYPKNFTNDKALLVDRVLMSYLFPLKMKFIQMEPCQIMRWAQWDKYFVALFDPFTLMAWLKS